MDGEGTAIVPSAEGPVAGTAAVHPRATGAAAVPVSLELTGRHADAVRRWVEGVLGWQAVDAATAELVPPAVRLVDDPGAAAGRGVPVVLLVDDDAEVARVARAVHGCPVDAVVGWPSGRDGLADEVQRLLSRPRVRPAGLRQVTVGGTAGGVGTTTVALALAGLAGWAGRGALAVLRAPAPLPELRAVAVDAVSAPDLWGRAALLPGVPGGRVIGTVDAGRPQVADPRVEVAVLDAGVDDDVDVLVCRPDRAALARLAGSTAALVVVNGAGPASPRAIAEAAAGRRLVTLPWSARVARAGLHGRVPGALPGSWLRRLAPVVAVAADP